jgi:arylsulfatase A-like enzyme
MKTVSFLLIICALSAAASGFADSARSTRPNVLFIMADDLGYGDVGCNGQRLIQTPNIDRLAEEGIKFTQFYAGSTVCAPSRSVLMTGLHVGHTRVRGNSANPPERQMLRASDVTIAEVLKQAGYATGLVGKWGLGLPGDEGVPNRQGFDYFFGFLSQVHAHQHYPDYLWRNDQKVPLANEVKPVGRAGGGYPTKKTAYASDLFLEEACAFIEENKTRPFFLYFASTIPHANNEAARELGNGAEVPALGIYRDKPWPEPEKGYAAMITYLDQQVGALLQRIKQLGLDENTLVIFTSDNGPEQKRYTGYDTEFFRSSGPLRGMKRDLTDGGIRVPFIVRWPGRIKPGATSSHASYLGDMMATFAELAGAPKPGNLDSISIVPTLIGQKIQAKHEYLYWEFYEGGVSQAVLLGNRWKGIRMKTTSEPIQLFDLEHDLGEQTNLAAKHPEVVARVAEIMHVAHVPNESWSIPPLAP